MNFTCYDSRRNSTLGCIATAKKSNKDNVQFQAMVPGKREQLAQISWKRCTRNLFKQLEQRKSKNRPDLRIGKEVPCIAEARSQ